MRERDPGNAPSAGERIGYIYISPKPGQPAPSLQGDRIETPEYIKEHKLVPDVKYYIEHQLMNPLSQLFALKVEDIPGFIMSASMKAGLSMEHKESIAGDLLFGDSLKMCDKQSDIRSFFTTGERKSPRLAAPIIQTAQKQKQITLTGFLVPQEPQSFASTKALIEEIAREKEKKKKNSVSPPPPSVKGKREKKKVVSTVVSTKVDA